MIRKRTSVVERFWAKVARNEDDECWIWTAAIDYAGYGHFRPYHDRGAGHHAHRYAWVLIHGPIASRSHVVCHTCANRRCVNPAHLYLGTCKQNTQDIIQVGNFHPFKRTGTNNPNARFTGSQIRHIRESSLHNCELARELNCHPSSISRIKSGVIYAFD